jgi:hypothetical protein
MKRLTLLLLVTALVFSCEKDIEVERISYFQNVNDTFDIKILGCVDAGYIWYFENKKSIKSLKVISDTSYSANPGWIGGYNYQVFTLVALKPGKEILRFEEYQPWQKRKSIDHRIWYTVHIAE